MILDSQPSASGKPPSPQPSIDNYRHWLRTGLALLLIGLVYFYRIDRPLLWDDEAETGVEARNILRSGYPTAYDGRNVTLFQNGAEVNRNLVYKNIPWNQYYVGALSMLIFGDNTSGLRILFALSGVLSFFPIYAILRPRLKYPAVSTALILLSPQIVLLQRNARYYPLLILLYAVLAWHLLRDFKSPRNHFILASLIFVLFFNTHPIAAMCSALSLVMFCLFFRREVLVSYSCACGVGFASWFIWYQLLGPSLGELPLSISLIKTHFSLWFKMFCTGLWAAVADMDVVGCFPLLLWTALLAFLLMRGRNVLRNIFRERLYAFVFLNILIQAVAGSALLGFETSAKYAPLRYEPHLLVFGLVASFMVLNAAIASKSLYLFAGMLAVASNFLTVSFWAKPLSRTVPASWLVPVYSEIFRPRENAWDHVVSRLESESTNARGHDIVMASLPRWTQNIAIFYLGDRYLVRPILNEPADDCLQSLHRIMGEQAFDKLFGQPEWIVDAGDTLKTLKSVSGSYDLAESVPSYQANADDGARPELTRHAFPGVAVVRYVRLYHLHKE